MELFHPSQIRWSSFANRNPTEIADLWPPLQLRVTQDQASISTTSAGTASSLWETSESTIEFSETAFETSSGNGVSMESLITFVEKEIGLAAIHTGKSDVAVDALRDSDSSTAASQLISLHHRSNSESCRAVKSCTERSSSARSKAVDIGTGYCCHTNGGKSHCRTSVVIRRIFEKVRVNCKGRQFSFKARKLVQKNVTLEEHLEDKVMLRAKAKRAVHQVQKVSDRILCRHQDSLMRT